MILMLIIIFQHFIYEGWINVEQQPDGTIKLRGVWRGENHQYFNFDSRNSGSFVYSDKGEGAIFELVPLNPALTPTNPEKDDSTPIKSVRATNGNADDEYYNLLGQRVEKDAHGIVINKDNKLLNK